MSLLVSSHENLFLDFPAEILYAFLILPTHVT
jgi:hypothetical protein